MQNAISSKFSLYCHITLPSTHISRVQDLVFTIHIYIAHTLLVFNNIDLTSTDFEPLIFLIIMKQKLRKLINIFFISIIIKANVLQAQNP